MRRTQEGWGLIEVGMRVGMGGRLASCLAGRLAGGLVGRVPGGPGMRTSSAFADVRCKVLSFFSTDVRKVALKTILL